MAISFCFADFYGCGRVHRYTSNILKIVHVELSSEEVYLPWENLFFNMRTNQFLQGICLCNRIPFYYTKTMTLIYSLKKKKKTATGDTLKQLP